MSTPIRIKRSAVPGKIPTTSDLQLGELAINTYDGKAYLKKDVSGVETVINVGGGYPGQTYYVTKTGLDTNDGQNISAAFATVKKALTVATANDTILIGSGTFTEIFPLTVPQGVTVRGNGLRSTFIQPTSGTERLDCFLLNGETTIQDLSIGNFYYNSSADTGYGFRFASNMVTTTRSPYAERVTVLNRGSTQTASDPYGFDTVDNYPTTKIAGRGALVDGSVVQSTTLEPAMLFNECTFITPNQTALKMTNGARAEWVNSFSYFSSISIDGVSGNVGLASTANATLKLAGVTTSISTNYVIKYYQGGTPVAIGTVVSVDGAYVNISGKGSGIFNAVGIGSTQDIRIFQSNGSTQVGTASTILWADYQKFGADLRAIGSASNFGTVGVRGDGAGVQLRLFGYNFGCVGSGKTFTQDPTLTIKSNEAIQLNGGRVFFQSVDQEGNFRVGSIFEISQETGAVSLASTSDINIAGTATIQNLNVIGLSTFQDPILHQDSNFNTDQTTYNLVNSAAGAVNFAGAGTSIVIGATTGITTIRNYRVNLSGGQDSFTTANGTLVVSGGVGISSNLNVGKDFKVTGVSTFVAPVRLDSSLRVAGVSTFVDDVEFGDHIRVAGVSTFNNPAMINSNLNVTGITTTGNFRVTGISTLSGDVQLSNNLQVTGIATFNNTISHNSALFITNQSTYRFIDTTTTTVTAFGDATTIGIGSTNATLTLRPSTVVGTNATQTLYNTVATTVNAFGAATAINVGANTGTLTIGNPTVVGTQATQTLYNTVATSVNAFGESTTLGIGSTNATLTLRPSTVVGTNATQTLYNTVATTVNAFGAATSLNLGNATSATITIRPGTVVGSNTTQTLYNTVATSVNAFGAATDIVLAATTGVTTVRNNLSATGTITAGNFTTAGIATFSGTANNINQTAGTAALNRLTVAGVSTFTGQLNYGTASGTTLNNTGTATFNNVSVTGVLTAPTVISSTSGAFTNLNVTGVGTIANFTISSGIITGPSAIVIDPAGVGDNTGSVRIKGDLFVDGTQTVINSTVVETGDKLIGLGTTAIEVIVVKSNVNSSIGSSTITGISTSFLSVGYGVSNNSTVGGGSSVVSIGSSTVTLSTNVSSDTNVTLSNVTIGIGTNLLSGISTSGIIVGAALSAAQFNANTFVTSTGVGTVYFAPVSNNVGVATTSVTFTNNGIIYFTDLLSGDAISDGGGISLYGKTNKTFTWSDSTDSWTSSEHIDLASGKVYKISGVPVLSSSQLDINTINSTTGNITNINGTTANYTNINNATNIRTVNLNVSGIGTIETFNSTYSNVTGISTVLTLDVNNATMGLVGINTLRAVAGIVTTLTSTVATIEQLGVTTASFKNISNATITGITTTNNFITTSFYATGIATAANILYVNSGIVTDLVAIGATITQAVITNQNVSGMATITIAGITSLTTQNIYSAGIASIANFRANIGFSTVFAATSGIITSLYTTGVGTVATFYTNVGVATRFDSTDLNVTGVGSFGTIANVNTPLGLSTIGYLAGVDISYTGIATLGVVRSVDINNTGIATFFTLNATGISSLANLYGSDIQYTGISTLTNIRGTNLYYSGLSTAVNFRSTDTIVSGVASISTLRADVGITTNAVWTDGYSAGITSVANLRSNVGIITTLTVTNSTQGYLIGTDIYYSGIGSISTLRVNVGFTTFLSGTNLSYTGVSTVVSLNATDVNVSGTTTITTLLISPNNQLTHLSNGTNLAFSGIGTIDTLRSNVGFVTTLSGTNLNYSGIGTIGTIQNINLNNTGVATLTNAIATNLNVTGIGTIATLNITSGSFTRLNSVDQIISGVSSVSTLRANVGVVTHLSATDLTVTGVGTINTIRNVDLNTTGIGTIAVFNATTVKVTGVSTFADIIATSIKTDALDLSGQAINFTGIATFNTLFSTNGTISYLRGDSLNFTGINTLSTIYNVNTNSTGFTTTGGLHVGVGGTILSATNVSGIGSVGINTSSPKRALQVYGELQINGNTVVGTISTTRSNNSAVKVHTSLGREEFRTVEYTVQASIGNTHQVTKILSIHDGVTAYNSEYSNVSTGVDVATYDVQIDNTVPPGFIALVVTPVSNTGITTIVVNYTATKI